ncbi:putative cytochrome P450 alkane hydroxylase [Bisporella sp. PMI_857]|nr:putative cytochrome P450 alkane hydroxylase [Bisporella sp. PMI_857]
MEVFTSSTFTLLILLLTIYFVVTYIISFITAYNFAKRHNCKPAPRIPQSERILGLANFLKQIRLAKAKQLLPDTLAHHRELGNTFSVNIMGRKIHVTTEPENVKALLSTQFTDFGLGRRMDALGAFLGTGIFTSDGQMWEHSRALVRPSFTKNQLSDLAIYEAHIQTLISKIPKDGAPIDLQPLFFQLTLDSATEFLLGESVNSLSAPQGSEQHLFAQNFDNAQNYLPTRLRLGSFVGLYKSGDFDRSCSFVHTYIDRFVAKALEYRREHLHQGENGGEKEKGKYIFANELALATDDPIQIRSELLNILLAGRDTTAGLLSNTLFELARRPEVWAKLKAEVAELEGRRPGYEVLRGMRYLKWVLNEGLRLYPSVPFNSRFATKNTTIPTGGGPSRSSPIFIAKGQAVAYSAFSMHRRRDIYGPDADTFRPERWENLRPGWGYLPFNGGPRICIGQQFALTEASYVIVRLVQEFERIEARDNRPWCEGLHLTLSSGNGVLVGMYGDQK